MVCGINLLYKNVSNSTNCNLDPAIFDPLPRKIFKIKRRPLNFSAHGKLDLSPKIIHFLVKLALEVKKAVGCGNKIWNQATLFRAIFSGKNCFLSYRSPLGVKISQIIIFLFSFVIV